ncbi:hypothetical protein KUW04_01265 [Halomonas denitrificans]|nr:hypothetical protein [Halomonas denitrificans]
MNARNLLLSAVLIAVAFCGALFAGPLLEEEGPIVQYRPPHVVLADNQQMNVYYFHGNVRCTTCKQIEKYTVEGVQQGFVLPLGQGKMQLKLVNVEEPENTHYIEDFELITRSVVVELTENGETTAWIRLDRVWELVSDRQAFTDYLYSEIDRLNPGRQHG